MDEIELLVAETFRHFEENFSKTPQREEEEFLLPDGPGVIYHVQKSSSIFVLRTLTSRSLRDDYRHILERPEDYPSLRLLEGGPDEVSGRLKFFVVDDLSQAEIIHDQLNNRRFPVHEEMICNLSDPGFSWWLTKKEKGFQISFNLSVASESSVKLGPLGDRELAVRSFQAFEALVSSAGIEMNIQNEVNRVQFTDCEEFILEELKDVFEFGVITDTLKDLFKILAKRSSAVSNLETTWFYLQELAAMRRFWIQIQYDLGN
jgi:hypothetical protein